MKFNESLKNLENIDSFYNATKRIKEYKESHPNNNVVSLGIGDVSIPVNKLVAKRMKEAIKQETTNKYVGYGNYYGLKELREAIRDNEYKYFSIDEIYVGQGTKSDVGDILELFDKDILIGIPNPTYPIYQNSCLSLNKKFEFIDCDKTLAPKVPNKHFDVIYICNPNNPTGISYSYDELSSLVKYCLKENCVLLVDNVYFKFISKGIKSIYEIEDAKKCAIEFRSFSKHVSFTGIRCSYYVIPNELKENVNKYWKLRTINRFNGASYIAQVGALASFEPKIQKELDKNIAYYHENAKLLYETFNDYFDVKSDGENAPYIWIKTHDNKSGWEMFEEYLTKLEVIVVPGEIFGNAGKGFIRVSALGKREDVLEAIRRIKKYEQEIK